MEPGAIFGLIFFFCLTNLVIPFMILSQGEYKKRASFWIDLLVPYGIIWRGIRYLFREAPMVFKQEYKKLPPMRKRWIRRSNQFSLLEASTNTIIGFVATYLAQLFIFPLLGIQASYGEIGLMTFIFTAMSVVKNYVVRRKFHKIYKGRKEKQYKKSLEIAKKVTKKEIDSILKNVPDNPSNEYNGC